MWWGSCSWDSVALNAFCYEMDWRGFFRKAWLLDAVGTCAQTAWAWFWRKSHYCGILLWNTAEWAHWHQEATPFLPTVSNQRFLSPSSTNLQQKSVRKAQIHFHMGEYRADGGNKLLTGPDAMKEMRIMGSCI